MLIIGSYGSVKFGAFIRQISFFLLSYLSITDNNVKVKFSRIAGIYTYKLYRRAKPKGSLCCLFQTSRIYSYHYSCGGIHYNLAYIIFSLFISFLHVLFIFTRFIRGADR